MKRSLKFLFILSTILVFALTMAGSALADNHNNGCEVPAVGPWPPCATGGVATEQWGMRTGMDDTHDGMDDMHDGMDDMHDGMDDTHDGMDGMHDGMDDTHDGMDGMHDGMDGMHDGMDGMHDGMDGMHDGMDDMHDGEPSLVDDMVELKHLLEEMGVLLDRVLEGSAGSCADYVMYYTAVSELPVYTGVPAELQGLHDLYVDVAVSALESNKDIFLLCESDGGIPSSLNYSIARSGINDSLDNIKAGIAVISEMMQAPAPEAPASEAMAPAEPAPEN